MHITLHLTVLMTSVHTPLLTEWSLVFRSEGGVGGDLRAESLAPLTLSPPPPPTGENRAAIISFPGSP